MQLVYPHPARTACPGRRLPLLLLLLMGETREEGNTKKTKAFLLAACSSLSLPAAMRHTY